MKTWLTQNIEHSHTGISGNNPIKLEIGDISDIALLCDTSEVNNLIEVNQPVES
ncbi:UNVERIFIED_ORG: hypothetical protein DFO82_2252 [Idiomarina abyssalis]|uniref:hypothetical protein n=1 Tax=Idiomarina sp. 017G TaxID=2183988 RepID=UPI000E2D5FB7|nr:hypothetical protein [Idiomarina sp. 017G]TDO47415.1 hypothetical protein DEU30_1081 [Idiomarina sp. 017G]|tara:strand:- start:178 stop:339 length:162 start_codon:yes stop_codon:yes gene_type:complete